MSVYPKHNGHVIRWFPRHLANDTIDGRADVRIDAQHYATFDTLQAAKDWIDNGMQHNNATIHKD